MKTYNKLVRDKIPEILNKKGVKHIARNADSPNEYWQQLKDKLVEEAEEFRKNSDPGELADILEVVDAICSFKKIDKKELKKKQHRKAKERGKFKKKIILVEAE